MNDARKRAAVEALLCAAGDANNVSLVFAAQECGAFGDDASDAVWMTYLQFPAGTIRFGDRLAIAAYRMIESSPIMRREWFGAR